MKKMNRWCYAFIGVLVLLFAGMVYAWSVLSAPIADEFTSWNKAQLSLTFTIVMIMFCIGCTVGGFLIKKISAKVFVWAAAIAVSLAINISDKKLLERRNYGRDKYYNR